MIVRRTLRLAALAALVLAPLTASAQMSMPMAKPAPTAGPTATPAEAAFLRELMTKVGATYPTAASAIAAGYTRYTNEDETGAISYVNPANWNSVDVLHPSQLWYDVHGKLLGVDISELRTAADTTPPARFGLQPSRWIQEHAHVHYVLRNADGTMTYGKAISTRAYIAANGDVMHPTAEGMVKAGVKADAKNIVYVVAFPDIWDSVIWVVKDPLGQWADANPAVIPSKNAGHGEDSM